MPRKEQFSWKSYKTKNGRNFKMPERREKELLIINSDITSFHSPNGTFYELRDHSMKRKLKNDFNLKYPTTTRTAPTTTSGTGTPTRRR